MSAGMFTCWIKGHDWPPWRPSIRFAGEPTKDRHCRRCDKWDWRTGSAEKANAVPRNDGSRCSPERPCPERNVKHEYLWGECYHVHPATEVTVRTDTQQALKDRIVAALVMNNWDSVFKEWWLSYNRASVALDQPAVDRSVGAYLDRMADDIAEALDTNEQLHAVLVGAEVVMLEALHRDPHDPNALELRARLAPFGYADDTEMIDGYGSDDAQV